MLADAVIDDRIALAALVTGAASGVGKAVCELLTREGYLVAAADRDEVGARAVADACGGIALSVDVADDASVSAMLSRAYDAFGGKLDALFTAATVIDAAQLGDEDDIAAFERVHAVHVLGTHLCIRQAQKRMSGGGRICTLAPSVGNAAGGSGLSASYASARGAVIALTRHAARSCAAQGIAVNCVAPEAPQLAPVALPLHERPSALQRIAKAVVWLLSPRAEALTGEIVTLESPAY